MLTITALRYIMEWAKTAPKAKQYELASKLEELSFEKEHSEQTERVIELAEIKELLREIKG